MAIRDLTLEEARRLFSYDPITGVLTRIACADVSKLGPCTSKKKGYVYIRANGAKYLGHRIAWLLHYGHWPNGQIDHRNRIRSDNRIDNLREADDSINNHNKPFAQKNSKLGVRGVSQRKNGRYVVQISCGGKKHNLGTYDTVDEAQKAYLAAKRRMHHGFIESPRCQALRRP